MFRLITHTRPPRTLVLEMKRDTAYSPALCVWIILGIVSLPFLPCFPTGLTVLLFPFSCYFGYRIYREYFLRRILRYEEDSITVTDSLDFRLFQWESSETFPRTESIRPIPWIECNVPKSFRLQENEPYAPNLYETRLPYREFGNGGTVCLHENEGDMLDFQSLIEKFWAEIPCPKSSAADNSDESHDVRKSTPTRVKKRFFTSLKKTARKDDEKHFTLNRGDEAVNRGEEEAEKGEADNPAIIKDEHEIEHGPEFIVTITEKKPSDNLASLELVSVKGGPISVFLGNFSRFFHSFLVYASLIAAAIFLIAYCIQWETYSPKIDQLLNVAVERFVPLESQGEVFEQIESYRELEPEVRRLLDLVPLGIILSVVPQLVIWLLSRFIRWPSWKRWTLNINYYRTKNHKSDDCRLVPQWRNDRRVYRQPSMSCVQFFKVIAARPETNRILTGRNWSNRNPGWSRPYQVVIITSWGSTPLPCAGPEEQERLIAAINKFVFNSLAYRKLGRQQ